MAGKIEGYRGNHVSKVWCLGNCSQVDIVEPKMCMCAHVCGMHEHAYREVHGSVCVCVCRGEVGDGAREACKVWVRKGIALTDGSKVCFFHLLFIPQILGTSMRQTECQMSGR